MATCPHCSRDLTVDRDDRCMGCGRGIDPILASQGRLDLQRTAPAVGGRAAPPSAEPEEPAKPDAPRAEPRTDAGRAERPKRSGLLTCHGCGRSLVTRDQLCVMCGRKASLWRAALGKAVYSERGVDRARRKILDAEAAAARAAAAPKATPRPKPPRAERPESAGRPKAPFVTDPPGPPTPPPTPAPGATGAGAGPTITDPPSGSRSSARPAAAPAPAPMSREQALAVAWSWLLSNGHPDAEIGPGGADDGLDIGGATVVALVLHEGEPVPARDVQRIHVAAAPTGRRAMLFSSVGFGAPALTWAAEKDVELYSIPRVTRIR